MQISGREYKAVWFEDGKTCMIDQSKLPYKFEIFKAESYKDVIKAIKDMIVRGAPAIGVSAAYGIAQSVLSRDFKNKEEFLTFLDSVAEEFRATRPTAHDLFFAIDFVLKNVKKKLAEEGFQKNRMKMFVVKLGEKYSKIIEEKCQRIGRIGEKVIETGSRILTHCNAGALGCVDYGTALAVIKFAHWKGKRFVVYVDETRPRFQGSKLTSWELAHEGIDCYIIADNAAGYYMQRGLIDLVIVGADRIAMNGDVVNKIGTYEKAVLAKEHGIPFYVAAPLSTIDPKIESGEEVPIEFRDEDEIHYITGLNESSDKIERVRITPQRSKALNPGFDITPARYITGIITEEGIFKPNELKKIVESSINVQGIL